MPVYVKGLRETQSSFRRADGDLDKLLKADLKEASEPVVQASRSKISKYRGAQTGSIRPRVTGRAVFVTQGARKRTGNRGDFGALQFRRMAEALDENEAEVRRGVEKALDRIIDRAGF